MMRRRAFSRLVIGAAILMLMTGWGAVGHRYVNGEATRHLPVEMTAFIAKKTWLADSSSVADWRKSGSYGYPKDATEGPKHFMDIDDYPEFATKSVSMNLDSLIVKYGSTRVSTNGISPWAMIAAMDSLTAQMKRGAWTKAWSTAADLGHYVGDAHMPLHNVVDYNGRASYPGSSGIHSRYESDMISRYQTSLTVTASTVKYISNPIAYVFAFIYASNAQVDTLYGADAYARKATGWSGSGSVPTAYLDTLWKYTATMTNLQMQKGSEAFASLMYTAWVNAGQPVPGGATGVEPASETPTHVALQPPYPNPFNPTTTVSFILDRSAQTQLSIISLEGRSVAILVDNVLGAGSHQVHIDADRLHLTSGVYFVRLDAAGRVFTQKLLYLR